jgi:hypothetical protein
MHREMNLDALTPDQLASLEEDYHDAVLENLTK